MICYMYGIMSSANRDNFNLGIEPETSWFLVRFISTMPQGELQICLLKVVFTVINFPWSLILLHEFGYVISLYSPKVFSNFPSDKYFSLLKKIFNTCCWIPHVCNFFCFPPVFDIQHSMRSEKILWVIQHSKIFWDLWPMTFSIMENVLCVLDKSMFTVDFGWTALSVSFKFLGM